MLFHQPSSTNYKMKAFKYPRVCRYSKHYATFDFESMLDRENLPENSKKLKWENKHVPLSFSICSITNGDS